jgi:hypothetical protein
LICEACIEYRRTKALHVDQAICHGILKEPPEQGGTLTKPKHLPVFCQTIVAVEKVILPSSSIYTTRKNSQTNPIIVSQPIRANFIVEHSDGIKRWQA